MRFHFDGTFQDRAWTGLPTPEQVEASLKEAIRGSDADVWKIEVDRVEVTTFGDDFQHYNRLDTPRAEVTVYWETQS